MTTHRPPLPTSPAILVFVHFNLLSFGANRGVDTSPTLRIFEQLAVEVLCLLPLQGCWGITLDSDHMWLL